MSSDTGLTRVANITMGAPGAEMRAHDLDLDVDVAHRMLLTLVNPTDEIAVYSLYFNGDHEDTHYWRQFIAADDEAVTSGSRNDPRITGLNPGESAFVTATLMRDPDGHVRATVSVNRGAQGAVLTLEHKIVWTVPENVTRIAVKADAPEGIGPGSRMVLYNTGQHLG